MGTRTWTRRGVLTAAGRARQANQGAQAGNVNAMPVTFDIASAIAPNPVNKELFAEDGAFAQALRKRALADVPDDATKKIVANLLLTDLITRDGGILAQTVLYDALGYNAPPTIESWDDVEAGVGIEKAPNGIPLTGYRAVNGTQYMDELRTGQTHWVGDGMQGNGTFVALLPYSDQVYETQLTDKSTGRAKNKPFTPTDTERIALAQGSIKLYGDVMTAIGIKAGARTNVAQLESITPKNKDEDGTSARPWTNTIMKDFNERYGLNLQSDRLIGFMAAALGYDAIVVVGNGTQYPTRGDNHTIILNRGKMVIASTDKKLY
jgi:hypothetical protein